MTRAERDSYDEELRMTSLNRKRSLISNIRKEYYDLGERNRKSK